MQKDLESTAPFQENGEEDSTAGGTETATWITVLGEGGGSPVSRGHIDRMQVRIKPTAAHRMHSEPSGSESFTRVLVSQVAEEPGSRMPLKCALSLAELHCVPACMVEEVSAPQQMKMTGKPRPSEMKGAREKGSTDLHFLNGHVS